MNEFWRFGFVVGIFGFALALYWELTAANENSQDAGNLAERSTHLRLLGTIFSVSPVAAFGLSILVCIVAPILLMFWRTPAGIFALFGAIGGFALVPWWGPKLLAGRAIERFEAQLPGFVDLMVSAVRGNLPLPIALSHVVPSLNDPLKSEVARLSNEALKARGGMSQAIEDARKRHASRNYSMLLAVFGVFSARGGNLVEPVQTMAKSFKEIHRLQLKMRTATSSARAAFWVMNAGMLFIVVTVSIMAPDMLDKTFDTLAGGVLFFIGVMIWAAGAYLLRKMTRVDI